jgi:hypothetical protein
VTVPFNEITEPGAYYNHSTGWLYRVSNECLSPGHSPVMNICCYDECYMTKISDDPWIPVGKAREVCANWDFAVNFKLLRELQIFLPFQAQRQVGLFFAFI